jgi:hypothetical protein
MITILFTAKFEVHSSFVTLRLNPATNSHKWQVTDWPRNHHHHNHTLTTTDDDDSQPHVTTITTAQWHRGDASRQKAKTRQTSCLGPLVCFFFVFIWYLIAISYICLRDDDGRRHQSATGTTSGTSPLLPPHDGNDIEARKADKRLKTCRLTCLGPLVYVLFLFSFGIWMSLTTF